MSTRRGLTRRSRERAGAAVPERLRQSVSRPRRWPARCRRRIRRSAAPMACMPSSSPARPSPRPRTPTGAPGCIASARRPVTGRSRRSAARVADGAIRCATRRRTSCAGIRCRCLSRPPIFSTGWSPWAATAGRRRRVAAPFTSTPPTGRCGSELFYDADGELLIVPQLGTLRIVTELGRIEARAAGDRGDSARRALSRRAAGRRGARLRLRELRRAVAPAGPRARSARTDWPASAIS